MAKKLYGCDECHNSRWEDEEANQFPRECPICQMGWWNEKEPPDPTTFGPWGA